MFAALARAIVWLKKDAMAILRSYGIAPPPDFWGVRQGEGGIILPSLREFRPQTKVRFWYNIRAEPFRRARWFLRVSSSRVAGLVNGAKEGF